MADAILTINAGSSSLKFALYEMTERDGVVPSAKGAIEGIGSAPRFMVFDETGVKIERKTWAEPHPHFALLLSEVLAWSDAHIGADRLVAVGHRVVHGGPEHDRPERVTPQLLDRLDELVALAPLHEPHNLTPIRTLMALRPQLPQVACFDTAFHRGMPLVATRFALPEQFEAEGIRRYGFHGLSYEYIAQALRRIAPDVASGRVIAAHLGNGASMCAMRDGHSIETTMGFTALDGLMMGTRSGSIDPGVILYLEDEKGMSAKEISELLYTKSGLLGVSGLSSDMRVLLASDEKRAREAVELFVYRIVREAGGLASVLGGLDGLVFTAGIGEHAFEVRARVCERLSWLGVEIDAVANSAHAQIISGEKSAIKVFVIPTDEEAMIARHALDIVRTAAVAA